MIRRREVDPDWVIRHVLQYGTDAEILEIVAVRRSIIALLRGISG